VSDVSVDGFLADSVASVDGKLYVLGAGWNRIVVRSFPARHDRVGVGLLFHVGARRSPGRRRFALRVVGPNGDRLRLAGGAGGTADGIEGEFSVGGLGDVTVPLALNLDGLSLSEPGRHSVVVSIDGEDVKTLGFEVGAGAPATKDQRDRETGTAGYL